jgi:teichuronic acid biosynthesis glycosyltransferase TuaC
MMRVLVLTTVFPNAQQPTLGVFVRERVRRVAEFAKVVVVAPIPWFPLNGHIRGRHLEAISPVEFDGTLEVHHPRFLCVPRYGKWLDGLLYTVSLVPFMFRLRRRFAFDVIDAHFAYPDGFAAVLLGRIFRRPVVITLRGSIVRLSTYPTHRPLLRLALRLATRIVAVSRSLKDVAIALGTPDTKVRVIPNGVDTAHFAPSSRAAARERLGLPLTSTIVLSVGGVNEGKGHHRIVQLLPSLLERHPNLLYVIVGGERPGDTSRPRIERMVATNDLRDHVWFAGERSHDEIPLWMAASDLFCLATRSEGWANVLLEAMACGLPVVTTRVGGNHEIISSPELGILVDPHDDAALARAIGDALARQWDRSALVDHARHHRWETAAAAAIAELQAAVRATPVEDGPLTVETTGDHR